MSNKKHPGQGVIEYSGALILAAILVSVAMSTGVNGLSNLFITIVDSAQNTLQGYLTAL